MDWQIISAWAIIGAWRLQCKVAHSESNRQLLLELCEALDLVVGNTFCVQPPSRQVTVYNVGSNPCSALIPANFGQIDFILTNTDWLHVLQDVASCMDMALASHHFPIIVQLDVAIPKRVAQPQVHQLSPSLDEPIRWFSFVHWHLMNVKCKFNLLCLPAPWKGCLLWHAGLTHSLAVFGIPCCRQQVSWIISIWNGKLTCRPPLHQWDVC